MGLKLGAFDEKRQDEALMSSLRKPRPNWMKRIVVVLLMAVVIVPCSLVYPTIPTRPQMSMLPTVVDEIQGKSGPLEVFQVYKEPVSNGKKVYETVIMEHRFGFSYGRPFVGQYKPPTVDFSTVHFTLSSTSQGRQFDRLALVFLGDHEVWRTSTAEPTREGIYFRYTKDMTKFLALLKQEQRLIFEMGNLVDETYTGKFAMKLTATFYKCETVTDAPADTIVAISSKKSIINKPSHFSLPQDLAVQFVSLSRKVYKATVLVSSSGNAAEEFWYANVVSKYKNSFPGVGLDGHGPHREVQVYVDGKLVAATFPFPVIYTGGISPGLWRPIVGIGAYDVPMYEFDLTPLLPSLWEGASIEIKVATGDDESIEHDWIVSGNVLAWTGETDGEGKIVEYNVEPLSVTSDGIVSPDKTTLNVTSVATRVGLIRSILKFEESREYVSSFWGKSESKQMYGKSGQQQRVIAETEIRQSSTVLGEHEYHYPLDVDSVYEFTPVLKISADIQRGLIADSETTKSKLWSHQVGNAYYIGQDAKGNGPYGGGSTEQGHVESNADEQYWRTVRALNGQVVRDLEVRDGFEKEAVFPVRVGDHNLFPACLEEYNQRSKITTFDASKDEGVKKCIWRMLGRGPL
ncbi:peptide N-acetyl-beta-D-glucosaminyl asparaginase amidase A-domain-containing protein [Lipomyces arxii]|uniref:peptide N-acetyl-beta-D-glucosaminyl asparaginase amidase A-domain-containing protein n=1 Tax=Lipomyces arxii TaxID=56418 RepID=UPI0034CF61D2